MYFVIYYTYIYIYIYTSRVSARLIHINNNILSYIITYMLPQTTFIVVLSEYIYTIFVLDVVTIKGIAVPVNNTFGKIKKKINFTLYTILI